VCPGNGLHHVPMVDGHSGTAKRLPFVELYPWQTGSGLIVDVSVPAIDGRRDVVKMRIPANAKNGARLHLPSGSDLRVRVLFWRTVLHAIVVAMVLTGLIAGAGTVSLLLAAAWILLQVCRGYTRRAKGVVANARRSRKQPKGSGFRYYLCEFGVLYLIPIGTAIAFYTLLGTYVSFFGGSLSLDQLVGLQRVFENVSKFFADNLKLNELKVLGLLVLVYIVSSVILATRKPRKIGVGVARGLHWLADVYTKFSGPIAAGLATLAAFSLFGMQLGASSTNLHPRIKIHQDGFAEVAKTVDSKLAEQVTSRLIDKISNAFPPDYRDALRLPTTLDQSVSRLQTQASTARAFQVSDAAVDQAVRDETARMQRVQQLPTSLTVDTPERREAPTESTPKQVDAAKQAITSTHTDPGVELASEGEKKIVLQVEKLITEQLTKVTKPVTDVIPILEPLMQSIVEAVDKSFQDRLEKAYNRVLRALMTNPGTNLDEVTAKEATAIVNETDVTGPVKNAEPRATSLARALRDKIAVVDAGGARLTQRMDSVVADLINNLDGTSLNRIEQARTRLRELGPYLTESHVQKLVSTMRNGNGEFIRHNAAIVVGESSCPYVTPELRIEAKSICGCH
jgi:hypothetical protein